MTVPAVIVIGTAVVAALAYRWMWRVCRNGNPEVINAEIRYWLTGIESRTPTS